MPRGKPLNKNVLLARKQEEVTRLRTKLEETEREMQKRGILLTDMKTMFTAWSPQLPTDFVETIQRMFEAFT